MLKEEKEARKALRAEKKACVLLLDFERIV